MAIIDFRAWFERYGYDPASDEAAREYQEARRNLEAVEATAQQKG